MSYLTKKRVVLDFIPDASDETGAYFSALDVELESVAVALSVETMEDMRWPNQVTVTVEPGDKLSEASVPEECCDRPVGCQSDCVFAQPTV